MTKLHKVTAGDSQIGVRKQWITVNKWVNDEKIYYWMGVLGKFPPGQFPPGEFSPDQIALKMLPSL